MAPATRPALRPPGFRVHETAVSSTMADHVPRHGPARAGRGALPRVNPARGSVASTRIEVRLGRNETLPGRLWAAPRPRAVVAVVHGLGEHCGRYEALAGDLVQAGVTVVSMDLPGHGEAPGPRGDMPSWVHVRDHAIQALWTAPLVTAEVEGAPRILLGHSMGGVMALDYALAHPRDLTAVAASAPGLRSAIPPWWKLLLANVARVATPSVGFATGLDESGMSRDPEVIRARAEDPQVHDRISLRLYHEFNEARQRVLRDARRLAVPALLMHGARDRVVDPAGTAEFVAAAPKERVNELLYPEAYHELFNDLDRARVIGDMLKWMEWVTPGAVARR